jgi:hypothetical protein
MRASEVLSLRVARNYVAIAAATSTASWPSDVRRKDDLESPAFREPATMTTVAGGESRKLLISDRVGPGGAEGFDKVRPGRLRNERLRNLPRG